MKKQLFLSALVVVGLGLVGGTRVVSAAPNSECGIAAAPEEFDCLVAAANPESGSAEIQTNPVPALAPELTAQAGHYEFDSFQDAYVWVPDETVVPVETSLNTGCARGGAPEEFDCLMAAANPVSSNADVQDNRVPALAPELEVQTGHYEFDSFQDAYIWVPDAPVAPVEIPLYPED